MWSGSGYWSLRVGVVLPKVFFGRPIWVFSCWRARKFLLAILVGPTGIYGNSCWANGDLTSNYRGSNFELFFEVRHLLAQRKYRGILVGPTGIYGNSCWPNGNIQEILLAQRETVKGRCWPTGILQRAPTANGQEPTVKSPKPKRGPKTLGNDTPSHAQPQRRIVRIVSPYICSSAAGTL